MLIYFTKRPIKDLMYKLFLATIFFIGTLIGISSFAYADDAYIDISYGVTSHSVDAANATGTHTSSNVTVDTDDTGYAIIIGSSLSDNLAGEVSYVNLGTTEIAGDGGDIDSFTLNGTANPVDFTASETIERTISGFGLGGAFHTGSDNFRAAARAGLLWWDTSGTKASNTTANDFVNDNLFDDGIDPYFGISLKYTIAMITAGLAYDSYGLNSFEDDASLLSFSLGTTF